MSIPNIAKSDALSNPIPDNHKASISDSSQQQQQQPSIPQLLPVDPDTADDSMPVLQFGDTLRFEELGPIILNADGTTRRIGNWDTMTEREQQTAWRRIKKRNEERRKVLESQQREEEGNEGDGPVE